MALGQTISVAIVAVPDHLQLCDRSSVGANVDCGSHSHQQYYVPAAHTNKLGEFLFLYVSCMWKFRCTDFVKCVTEL